MRAHRTALILEKGYALFLDKGLAEVEMIQVAVAADVSRATLYRYFPSKRDLAFAVMGHIAQQQLVTPNRAERKTYSGTGRDKFARFLGQLVRAYRLYPDFFRFSAMVSRTYGAEVPPEVQAQAYREMYPGLFLEETPEGFLIEGQRDGSVRSDLDPKLYFSMVLAAVPAAAEHLALDPELARQLYKVDQPATLLDCLADALVRGLA